MNKPAYESGWISVQVALPRDGERVLAVYVNPNNRMQEHIGILEYHRVSQGPPHWTKYKDVTYWRPLPELPQNTHFCRCELCGRTASYMHVFYKQIHGQFKQVTACDTCKKQHEVDLERTRQNFQMQYEKWEGRE